MSATTKLLQAACEIAGGRRAFAQALGTDEILLARYMAGTRALPDVLLLRAVDVILKERQQPLTVPGAAATL